jgi:hypothetical protein
LKLYLGKTSNDEPVLRDFADLPIVFLVYNEVSQLEKYLKNLSLANDSVSASPHWNTYRVISRYRIEDLAGNSEFDHFKDLKKRLTHHIRFATKNSGSKTLLIIDDLFNLKLFTNKADTNFLLKLLEMGEQHFIYLLIGTSGIFRGLLKSLVSFSNAQLKHNISDSFSELVINEEELVFFREKGTGTFMRYF